MWSDYSSMMAAWAVYHSILNRERDEQARAYEAAAATSSPELVEHSSSPKQRGGWRGENGFGSDGTGQTLRARHRWDVSGVRVERRMATKRSTGVRAAGVAG